MEKIVECVPNFSEGRDQGIIDAIAAEITAVEGVKLLGVDPDKDYNRTVVTLVGEPQAVVQAAFAATKRAADLIDMTEQKGEHPRLGATDVVPFVPVSGVTMEECVQLAHQYAKMVGEELGIPVYLYEEAATRPERRNLAKVRKGEYEGLAEKLQDPDWEPDYGPVSFNAKSGGTISGARVFLIAYNVNLDTSDVQIAQTIAQNIRESGRVLKDEQGQTIRDENGKAKRMPGSLKAVKAMGVLLEEQDISQVSINLVNYQVTAPHVAFEEVKKEAVRLGAQVTGSEIVGLTPLEALLMAARHHLSSQGQDAALPDSELVKVAAEYLGLSQLQPFDAQQKVIEFQIGAA
ncbi:glutamate formimidoyltransferase [Candidatus Zixiibacteriota bacterium]